MPVAAPRRLYQRLCRHRRRHRPHLLLNLEAQLSQLFFRDVDIVTSSSLRQGSTSLAGSGTGMNEASTGTSLSSSEIEDLRLFFRMGHDGAADRDAVSEIDDRFLVYSHSRAGASENNMGLAQRGGREI